MKGILTHSVFLVLAAACVARGQDLPKLTQRVNDFTNTFSYVEWGSLEKEIKQYEDTTSNQLVVLMVATIGEDDIESYANRVFTQNNIGQAKKNNGVLLVIAKDDRKMRIEVGYGLEGALTDAICSRIIRKEITPHFQNGSYYAGVLTGVNAIMMATAGEYKADPGANGATSVSFGLMLVAFIFIFFFFLPLLRSRRRTFIGSAGPFYYSGWGYRGGGGGFGAFGGRGGGWSGGGGMSGGGGASGSW